MERWVVTAKRDDFQRIAGKFKINPVTARIIRNRDIVGDAAIEEYLNGNLENLHSAEKMKDMLKAVDLILNAIQKKQKIRIIGDYDIDGVVSTHILFEGLSQLGAAADTEIPHRILDGYGLHERLIRRAAEDKIALIVTCDNGIAAYNEIALAKELGICVVVTDHHQVPYCEEEGKRVPVLPPADAIVNPHQEDCPYPFKDLCGAGVAYKVISVLYERCGMPAESYEKFLELVAIATVGDVMDLQGENRILVKEGIRRLSCPKNIGIRALIEVNQLDPKSLSAYHIGFVLGPCINASGRLDTALRSLELLNTKELKAAYEIAGELKDINESRKALTERYLKQAVELVETSSLKNDRVLVVYLEDCHESLAGIIAGRLREQYHRPAIVLTNGEQEVKGSGRSIEEYSMFEELNKCAGLLLKFGGHPMAAGLSLKKENVERFRRELNGQCSLTKQELIPKITIDVPMPVSYVTEALIEEFRRLEPFGKANPRPLFAQKGLEVTRTRVMGKKKNVVQMILLDENHCAHEAVYFGDGEQFCREISAKKTIDIVYYPKINEWQGKRSIRIMIQNYQ